MNNYKKYSANVFVMETTENYKKGDIATITSRHGKETQVEIYNSIPSQNSFNYYSFVRLDGVNAQTIAKKRAEKAEATKENKLKKSQEWYEKSKQGSEFLALAEPIKVGHHSEHRHRALFEKNWARMGKSVKLGDEAEAYNSKIEYWESKANDINLSMPESVDFYQYKLTEATEHHVGLKNGTIKKQHSLSTAYANNKVKELKSKVRMAEILWG